MKRWLALLLPVPAFAGGDEITQDTNVDNVATSQAFASANTVEGDDNFALGISHGLGDVDINDCLASTAKANILWSHQGTKLNKWCAAERYDAMRLHDMAARLRCQIPAIRSEFRAKEACIKANTYVPRGTSNETNSHLAEQQAVIDEQRTIVEALSERLANLEEEEAKERKRRREAQNRPQTIIQQSPFLTPEKRAALAAIRGDE